mgnify:FL=1
MKEKMKIVKILILFLLVVSCDNFQNKNPNVKKSTTDICHKKGSQYYKQTKNFISFDTISACLESGGRLPR